MAVDLVLSSGFLAFARQTGFLQGVEDCGLEVEGICGTSSGALTGAMWAAGLSAQEIFDELCGQRPLSYVRPHLAIWRGAFSLDAVLGRLREVLPPTFADLDRPFAVGVVVGGRAELITEGLLAEAVAASCAVPYLFAPVRIGGRSCSDGGALDRTGLDSWRSFRGQTDVVLHMIERSGGAAAEVDLSGVRVVHSGRSGATFWNLGDVGRQFAESRQSANTVLATTR